MTTTATAIATKKSFLPKIESYRPEVKNSASVDLEWIPYKGKYSHEKTHLYGMLLYKLG